MSKSTSLTSKSTGAAHRGR